MKVTVGAVTDIGRVRENNEDAFLAGDPLYAVADGMGGHRGGEVASKLALDTLEELFHRGGGRLADQVQAANQAVYERSSIDRSVAGMGTTLTAANVEGNRVRLVHVGDSRAYLFRHGRLELLTEDHTLVQRMVRAGEITKEEAERHPQRNVMTRAIGTEYLVAVDEVMADVQSGDRLVLCTDGLTGMVTEERIRAVLESVGDPQKAAEQLVEAANSAGGVDNITVVVLDFAPDEAPTLEAGAVPPRASPHPTPAPERPVPKRRVRPARIAVFIAVPIAIVALGLVGLRFYLDRQWYVGEQGGRVAVFRGIPAEVAGFELHHPVVVSSVPADKAEQLDLYKDLADGITADSREDAEAILEQIRSDVASPQPGGATPSPTPTSTRSPGDASP